MKIIMLVGQSNCGKTTTIRKVYDEMAQHAIKKPKAGIPDDDDFEAVLKHRSGQRIGFHSTGDTSGSVIDAMRNFSDNDRCDILVCACNERFSDPHGAARQIARGDCITVYKPEDQAPENERDAENEEYKSIIIALIISLVNDRKLITAL
jgi:hypothetical protein